MALSYIGTAVSSVPILHLHLDLLAPWERIQGTGDSEPPTPQDVCPLAWNRKKIKQQLTHTEGPPPSSAAP